MNKQSHIINIDQNDIADSMTGVNVSVWFQGCPHKCKGCHNPKLWSEDFSAISDTVESSITKVCEALKTDGIKKGLSILGGEPLAEFNIVECAHLINAVREEFPDIKIYVWTGYTFEQLHERLWFKYEHQIMSILSSIDYLIDGPFIEEQKGTYKLRGSKNQRILEKGKDF